MEQLIDTGRFVDSGIQKRVEQKMAQLKVLEAEVPAVFIVHRISDMSVVYMSPRGLSFLGATLREVQLSFKDYHNRYFNLEDAEYYTAKVLNLLAKSSTDEFVTYFQQVRPSPEHEWVWHLSSTRIFVRDLEEKPLLLLTLAIPIDSKSHITAKVDRLQSEYDFLRKNQHIFAALTKREREILKLMALGLNSEEISERLHISELTVSTHRRNIKSKINAQTSYDITRFAQAFDLI